MDLKSFFTKQIIVVAISVFALIIAISSITYAYYLKTNKNNKDQIITTGDLKITYNEGKEIIKTDLIPMIDELGMNDDKYTFSINNSGTLPASFTITLSNSSDINQIDSKYIRYSLNGETPDFLSNIKNGILYQDVINSNETKSFSLGLWVWLELNNGSYLGAPDDIKGKSLDLSINVTGEVYKCSDPVLNDFTTNISKSMNKTCGKDDISTFYYKNNTDTNNVLFAGLNWKIIRINESGSLRLLLVDKLDLVSFNEIDSYLNDFYNKYLSNNIVIDERFCEENESSYVLYGQGIKSLSCNLSKKIGILSLSEYDYLNKDLLNVDYPYWVSSLTYEESNILIDNTLTLVDNTKTGYVRPVINISPKNIIGSGYKSDPFIINN